MEKDLNIWLWESDWAHPWPHEVGLLRSFLASCGKERLDTDELALVSAFLDDRELEVSFEHFIGLFDMPYMAEIAKKCVMGREDIEKASKSVKISVPVGQNALEFSLSENGDFEECVYVERTWAGDARRTLPGDMARVYWQNLAAHLDDGQKEKMEEIQETGEREYDAQILRF